MKKVFKLIFVSIFFLLFFIILNVYIENDLYNIHSKFGFNNKYENTSISFNSQLEENEKLDILDKIESISLKNSIAIDFSNYKIEDDELKEIETYISSNDNFVREMLPVEFDLNSNFYDNNQIISSDDKIASDGMDLYLFNDSITYTLIPMHHVKNDLQILNEKNITFYYDSSQKIEVSNTISNEFREYDYNLNYANNNIYDLNGGLSTSLIFISVISSLIFILFVLFTISVRLKDIAILKLNGYKIVDLIKQLFLRDLVFSIVLALVIPLAFSLIILGEFNLRILEFIKTTIGFGLILVIIFSFLMFLSSYIIKKYRLSDFLKNKNNNNILTNITYLLLIMTAIIILPSISDQVNNIKIFSQQYIELIRDSDRLKDIYNFNINDDGSGEWEYDIFSYSNGQNTNGNQNHIELYNDLSELGILYKFSSGIISSGNPINFADEEKLFLTYEINKNYFDSMEIEKDGLQIEIEDDKDVNILMDEKTYIQNEWSKDNFNYGVNAKIYLYNQINYLKLEQNNLEEYSNSDGPIIIYTTNENVISKNLSNQGYFIDMSNEDIFYDYVSENNLEDIVDIKPSAEIIGEYNQGILYLLERSSITLLPGLISLFAVFIAYTNFYYLSKEKEIKVLKSLGYTLFDLVKQYLNEIILVNVIFLVFSLIIINNINVHLIGILTTISIIMTLYLIYKIKNTKVKEIKER